MSRVLLAACFTHVYSAVSLRDVSMPYFQVGVSRAATVAELICKDYQHLLAHLIRGGTLKHGLQVQLHKNDSTNGMELRKDLCLLYHWLQSVAANF